MTADADVIVVGAGPYGLSIAAHLRASGVECRVIGPAMQTWLARMPKGMLLKSAGFASNLYDPERTFTLRRFCSEQGLPYEDIDLPVPLETFCRYGLAFQRRFVPDLEDDRLALLSRHRAGFELRLERGRSLHAPNVVLAVGLDYFTHTPDTLARLPATLASHSADHHDLDRFEGQDVAVIGSGASAIDLAVLLHESGARVHHVVRRAHLPFGTPWRPASPTLWHAVRSPISAIGPGWVSLLCTSGPSVYRYLPERVRLHTLRTHLSPSGGWFMKERAAPVSVLLGCDVVDATASAGRVQLAIRQPGGTLRRLSVDHVIAATGFRPDLRRVPFLSPDILDRLQLVAGYPRLSPCFESSLPGLYFVGLVAAATFGPVMRFAAGAEFTSRRITQQLATRARPRPNGNGRPTATADERIPLVRTPPGVFESPRSSTPHPQPGSTHTVVVIGATKALVVQTLLAIRAHCDARCLVICPKGTRFLRLSRLCNAYLELDFNGADDDDLVEYTRRVAESAPDVVLVPADCEAARMTGRVSQRVRGRMVMSPDMTVLDCFDDKWRFHQLCAAHGLNTPPSRLVGHKHELEYCRTAQELGLPFVVKPVNQSSSRGVRLIFTEADYQRDVLHDEAYRYAPLLVQSCIRGTDVGLDFLSVGGRVAAIAIQQRLNPSHDGSRIRFFHNAYLEAAAHTLATASGYDGVMNIDARIEDGSGEVFLLEANPRVWRSLSASVWCGMNFVAEALERSPAAERPRVLASGQADTYYHPVFRPSLWPYALFDTTHRGRLVRLMIPDVCILITSIGALSKELMRRSERAWRRLLRRHGESPGSTARSLDPFPPSSRELR